MTCSRDQSGLSVPCPCLAKTALKALLCMLSIAFLLATAGARATDFRLYAAAGVKLPLLEMALRFASATGHRVLPDFDTAGAAQEKFQRDTEATFLITTLERVQSAQSSGQLSGGRFVLLADTVAGIASNNPRKPVIRTSDDLRRALLAARSIAFSDPARGATVGRHFAALIRTLGIESEVLAKSVVARDGVETMRLLLSGKVELGVTQLSEVVQADRTTLVGPFPPEFDLYTRYVLWIRAPENALTDRFLEILASDAGRRVFSEQGLRPLP